MSVVLLVQELPNVSDGVAIEGLAATRRKRHGDHAVRYVGQVQVKVLINIAALILRDLCENNWSEN